MSRVLRVLHVGVGNRGTWPLTTCASVDGFVSTGLCDVNESALRSAGQVTGVGKNRIFRSLGQALETCVDAFDCAVICTPTRFHVEQAQQCLSAGLSVLVEKGMAPDWRSARELVAQSEQSRGKLCVAQNYRFNSLEKTIFGALKDPSHPCHPGPVHQVTYNHQRVRPEPRTLDYPFAAVWDMSCHHFDTLGFWFGALRRTTAFDWGAAWSAYEHRSNTSAHLEYENGAVVHYLHAHDAARASQRIEIHGERGALTYCESAEGKELFFSERPREQFGTRPRCAVAWLPSEGEKDLLLEFREHVLFDRATGISAQSNLETMAACEMMTQSIREGRPCLRTELPG